MNRWGLVAVSFFGWAFWAFATKIVSSRMHPLAMQISSATLGLLCMPFFISVLRSDKSVQYSWPGIAWAIAGGIAGVSAYMAYSYALKTGEIGTISIITSCYPILTCIAAIAFLGEPITIFKVLGIASIVLGVVLMSH